jgi:hypothetical protein
MKTSADMDSIARRRRQLNIDYQLKTRSWLDTHDDHGRTISTIAFRCFAAVRRQFLSHYFFRPPRWRLWMRRLVKKRATPDFCIIGPVKSGSSDLAVTIMSHPNVLHPLAKEFGSTDPVAWKSFYPTLREVEQHARRHGIAYCACVAPYLHCLDVPITLSALRPDAKIVITLRNPVDVVFSVWKWTVLHGEKQWVDRVPYLRTFSAYVNKAVELFPEVAPPTDSVLHSGIYATSVAHWLQAFDERNLRVFDIADYFKDRNGFIQRLEQFLGLPHVPLPPQLPVANRNPLEPQAPDRDASAKLKEFFEPYNRRLWRVIGTEYPW